VRQIFIIEMTEPAYKGHKVAVIEIGMAEVSSCNPTVIEGQHLKKGDQLGYFEFGGSSHAIIFDENLNLEFVPGIHIPEPGVTPPQPPKQLVNSKLATITGLKNPYKYPHRK
jgi:phosphatidylserine decarboxylase